MKIDNIMILVVVVVVFSVGSLGYIQINFTQDKITVEAKSLKEYYDYGIWTDNGKHLTMAGSEFDCINYDLQSCDPIIHTEKGTIQIGSLK